MSAEWLTARPVRRSCHMPDEPKVRSVNRADIPDKTETLS
jgi:hypothetical protein